MTTPILLLGAGRMGGALAEGWRRAGAYAASDLILRDPHPGPDALAVAECGARLNPPDAALAEARTVLLAVKPQMWREAAAAYSGLLAPDAVIVSIAAGVRAADIAQAFGLNDLLVGSAPGFTIRPDIKAAPLKLSIARPDLSGAVGPTPVIFKSDVRGADALGNAGLSMINFNAVGWAPGGVQSLNDYLSGFGANIARVTDAAMTRKTEQEAVSEESTARRASVEGVNLD